MEKSTLTKEKINIQLNEIQKMVLWVKRKKEKRVPTVTEYLEKLSNRRKAQT